MSDSGEYKIEITADQQVEELVEKYPALVSWLLREGIVCIKCGEPYWGTIGDLIKSKRLDPNKILARLNTELNK
jgi:hypothetical protein